MAACVWKDTGRVVHRTKTGFRLKNPEYKKGPAETSRCVPDHPEIVLSLSLGIIRLQSYHSSISDIYRQSGASDSPATSNGSAIYTIKMFRPTYDSEDEADQHLPRILMFHGGGTNSRIFRAQTRVLRRLLRPHFRFVFVEAPYISHPGPGVVKVFQDMGSFKGWLRWRDDDCYRGHIEATQRIHDAIEAAMVEDDMRGGDGEWVGVLGFSQGAKLAASLLYTQQYQHEVLGKPSSWPRFKFGILLQGRAPLVWLDAEQEVPTGLVDAAALSTAQYSNLAPIPLGRRLHIPTLHVHGLQDPGLQYHRGLLHRNCDTKTTRLLELDVGHRVPIKPMDCTALTEEIIAIARKTNAIR